MVLSYCTFDGCRSTSGKGGAIYCYLVYEVFITDSQIMNCIATYSIIYIGATTFYSKTTKWERNVFYNTSITGDSVDCGGAGVEITRPNVGLTYVDCNFSLCSCNGNKAGALYFLFDSQNNIGFTLDGCIFNETSTDKGAGGAVQLGFDITKEFVVTVSGCHFISCEAGGSGGVLAIPTGTATASSRVTVSQSTFLTSSAVDGGAIWIQMPVASLTVSNCAFDDGKASGGNGGFIKMSTCSQQMNIEDTIFTGGKAQDGGCVYLESQTQGTFSVSNVTIDACGSSTGGHSVFVKATNTLLHGLTLKNMPSGYGRLQLSASGFSDNVISFHTCTFEVYGTQNLMDFATTADIRVELISCTFHDVSASGNLFNLEASAISDISLVNCTLCKVTCNWAMVVCRRQRGTFTVEGCHFEDVVVNNQNGDHEVLFDATGFTKLSFYNNTFQSCRLKNGILRTGSSGSKTSLQSLVFNDCQITRDRSSQRPYGFLNVVDGAVDFEECHRRVGSRCRNRHPHSVPFVEAEEP